MTVEKTHITMVLDRSGSMADGRDATIMSVNKYLAEARGDTNLATSDFELMIFDTLSIDTIRSGTLADVKNIGLEDFVPRDCTPLFDAVGRGIDSTEAKLKAAGTQKAILVIVTDGMENASRKHTQQTISEIIEAKKTAGWLIVFLGAGLDAAKQGLAMGVGAAYTASFSKDRKGMGAMAGAGLRMSSSYGATRNIQEAAHSVSMMSFSEQERGAMGDASDKSWLKGGAVPTGKITINPGPKPAKSDTWTKKPEGDAWGG